jgi:hypothetical protein
LATGVYKLLKLLNYADVNGAEDRDDTMVVARIEREVTLPWSNGGKSDDGESHFSTRSPV